jgi:hypothetical protein
MYCTGKELYTRAILLFSAKNFLTRRAPEFLALIDKSLDNVRLLPSSRIRGKTLLMDKEWFEETTDMFNVGFDPVESVGNFPYDEAATNSVNPDTLFEYIKALLFECLKRYW